MNRGSNKSHCSRRLPSPTIRRQFLVCAALLVLIGGGLRVGWTHAQDIVSSEESTGPDQSKKRRVSPDDPDKPEETEKEKSGKQRKTDKEEGKTQKSEKEGTKKKQGKGKKNGETGLPYDLKHQPESESESEEDSKSDEESESSAQSSETTGGEPKGKGPGGRGQQETPAEQKPSPPQLDVQPEEFPLRASFGSGFRLFTSDKLYSLTIHDETQFDARLFSHVAPGTTQDKLHDGFNIPRQRLMFVGDITHFLNYNVTLQAGIVGRFDILNAYFDWNPWGTDQEYFHVRVGRFKTPYAFDWFKVHNWNLVSLERPLFSGNFTTNREDGVMVHGLLLADTFEYDGGVFNGQANTFYPFDNSKDFIAYLDEAPFLHSGIPLLQYMHVAGSLAAGVENNVPNEFPVLHTASQGPTTTAEASIVSPTFLQFGANVVERGLRELWTGDFYWFYHSFNLFLEYNGGFIHYAPSETDVHVTRVPLSGYSITASYFLTGERETQRVLPEPLHPINGKGGGYGAWEVYSRFAHIDVGSDVFTAGLVNPAHWANRVNQENTGINWFLNKWTRITLEWQHSNFNRPVELSTNKYMNAEDLYWMRFQLFY